jgi:hypothetical protein
MKITDQELIQLMQERLPKLLREKPEIFEPIYTILAESFVERGEIAELRKLVLAFQGEAKASFLELNQRLGILESRVDSLEERMDRLETKVDEGFDMLSRKIDRLGQRWGIRTESVFRETMTSVLEKSFGAKVERKVIQGEEYDVVISNGDHIVIEITASVKRTILQRIERKRSIYIEATNIVPTRFILATATIHSKRVAALEAAGFEVVEAEDED